MTRRAALGAAGAVFGAPLLWFALDSGSDPRLVNGPDWARPTEAGATGPASDEEWLSAGSVPGAGTAYADMARTALLDLRALTGPDGSVAAGPTGIWRYAWPRDSAFVAAAFARWGHPEEAAQIFRWFEKVQRGDGDFEARYVLESVAVPDERPLQLDGGGWLLWALGECVFADRQQPDAALAFSTRALARRTADRLLMLTGEGRRLPPVSPDYWEVRVADVSLGEVTPMAIGLDAAGRMAGLLGLRGREAQLSAAAARLWGVIASTFGPSYQRFGTWGGRDSATNFLLPPLRSSPRAPTADVMAAWRGYQQGARRPAGGLAPGTAWGESRLSWTPHVALTAYAASGLGLRGEADRWLRWLDQHRAAWGSLPEKVTGARQPAGPAPLAWSAALVLLTVAELSTDGPGSVR